MRSACLLEESMGSSAARTGITAPARKVLPPHEKCFQVAYQTPNRPDFSGCLNKTPYTHLNTCICSLSPCTGSVLHGKCCPRTGSASPAWEIPRMGNAFRLPIKTKTALNLRRFVPRTGSALHGKCYKIPCV